MTLAPGIHTIPAESYHADEIADQPSLSASIASILCQRSPRHAWAAHPRLNPLFTREAESKFDVGNCAHSILLEGKSFGEAADVLPFDSWRTNAAKEARAASRALERVPLLSKDADAVQAMLDAAREQLAEHDAEPTPFTDGQPERTLVWEENGVTCRALVDWLRDDFTWIFDYKTAHNASPEHWARSKPILDHGYDVQAAFHSRGVEAITGIRPRWRWIVQEKTAPYSLISVEPASDLLTVANAKVDYALRRWRECMESGVWPSYSTDVVMAELPAWADDAKWLVDEHLEAA